MDVELKSFTQHKIQMLGKAKLKIAWPHKENCFYYHTVYVVSGDTSILGQDLICRAQASLEYTRDNMRLHFQSPPDHKGYVNIDLLQINAHQACTGMISTLEPGDSAYMQVPLPTDVNYSKGQYVLCMNLTTPLGNYLVYPTRSKVNTHSGETMYCTALVCNTGTHLLEDAPVTVMVQPLEDDYQVQPVPKDITKQDCQEWATSHRLQQEVLVNNIHISYLPEDRETEFPEHIEEAKETYLSQHLYSNEYTKFDQDVAISHAPHVPPPSQPVDQVVELENFDENLQPFLADIFLKKYPEVVSLHSMDAGNLSVSLGHCSIKLKSRKVMPETKRLYKLSAPDAQHLYDILRYLQKFGYIKKVKHADDLT